jgi:N6-L-threonylcarbamoyladenine synthase/protein kinase Bud32
MYKPTAGGIHPTEAGKHHRDVANKVLEDAIAAAIKSETGSYDTAEDVWRDIDFIAYSAGPGLAPCLLATLEFAQKLGREKGKLLLPVNHCVAHVEIGKQSTGATDPIVLYVSGGNTQVLGYAAGRYRVFGETLDIAIGNAIDTFIREAGGGFPGGPIMEKLAADARAKKGENAYIELPYVVKGMDLSFSGIVTAALQRLKKGASLEDVCFSFQETCYAMLAEVTERAMAHTGKNECLLTGGVAASKRLQEMLRVMCEERGARFFVCPTDVAGDNAAMIAWNGLISAKSGQKGLKPEEADFNPRWRTDETEITWLE